MKLPKMFIGSSQKNKKVADELARSLKECAFSRVWDEDVFGLNQNFLEELLRSLREYDFAAFVLAPDDMTTSKEESKPSPRDNVLFESGLFMGVLGREHVFLVCDQSVQLKIPSDLAGLTLASYDGEEFKNDPQPALRDASTLICNIINKKRFEHLVGEWKSVYPMIFEEGCPRADEEVEIRPGRDGVFIINTSSPGNEYNKAFGRLLERQIIGEWKSRAESSDASGVFVLTVARSGNFMYGYFTSPTEEGAVKYASWILAKKAGADEAKITERLKKAEDMLKTAIVPLSMPQSAS